MTRLLSGSWLTRSRAAGRSPSPGWFSLVSSRTSLLSGVRRSKAAPLSSNVALAIARCVNASISAFVTRRVACSTVSAAEPSSADPTTALAILDSSRGSPPDSA